MQVRIALISAALAALVTALIVPYTDPENLAKLSQHPLAGLLLNRTADAFYAFGNFVGGGDGDDPAAGGPSLRDYYPLTLPPRDPVASARQRQQQQQQRRRRRAPAEPELDWADPRVWEAQTLQARVAANGSPAAGEGAAATAAAGAGAAASPYYSPEEIDAVFSWCGDLAAKAAAPAAAADGAAAGDTGSSGGGTEDAAAVHFRALVEWVAAAGGDASKVEPGLDASGVRGLHARVDVAEGETVLSVPLSLGLSIASFRAARYAAAAVTGWSRHAGADLFLDPLALAYEAAVHGARSPWGHYLCLLPRSFAGLPMHAGVADAALLAPLPALRRLAAKRRAEVALYGSARLGRAALADMPGGRGALLRLATAAAANSTGSSGSGSSSSSSGGGGRDLWMPLWHWAYAAAKTRTVNVAAAELRAGGGIGTPGEDRVGSIKLPVAIPAWAEEFGVMLPVLDLANHVFMAEGANVLYQILPPSNPAEGWAAVLVATRPIAAGEALLFDYVAGAEDGPSGMACTDRWLEEYGFLPHTSDPHRECDTFDISRPALAAALAQLLLPPPAAATGAPPSPDAAREALAALVDAGLARVAHVPPGSASSPGPHAGGGGGGAAAALLADPSSPPRLEVLVRTPSAEEVEEGLGSHVRQRWVVLSWLAEALRGAAEAAEAGAAGAAGSQVAAGLRRLSDEPEEVLAALLAARREELAALEAAARAGGAGGPGEALRRGVVGVAEVARRAVERALAQERARMAG
ncbi:hypothetical protein HXX76_005305 [Chlamydomonas incerta]|uniref:SET domain-containing protein n=1 Tax=Chlamydomonas incerta TaxID=51695 RepID=A0A835W7S3_CHLIN|nr:hypothetical protein HXX76_005305 [Chlamydomonas incerta]|eukprot:KAG2438761.1 hypothetical protein HXX76_005305 [Chlamydomonas incerta]